MSEQEEHKPLIWLVDESKKHRELFSSVLSREFRVTCFPALTPQYQRQLKRIIKQETIAGVVCGLDATGVSAQRKAWFYARKLFKMNIPVACYSWEEYDDGIWHLLRGRFPELNSEVPYLALEKQSDQATAVLDALHRAIIKQQEREHKEKSIANRLLHFLEDRFY